MQNVNGSFNRPLLRKSVEMEKAKPFGQGQFIREHGGGIVGSGSIIPSSPLRQFMKINHVFFCAQTVDQGAPI